MSSDALTDWITTALGRAPDDAALYQRALTHGSHGALTYERLEFLGDRVLGLAAAAWLYERFPDEPEGALSRRINMVVSRETCAEVGRAIGVPARLRLGKQARDDGAVSSDNVVGDAVEALIGALFLEGGLGAAEAFVRRNWSAFVDGQAQAPRHPKSALQEWAAAHRCRPPVYTLDARTGAHHAPRFTVSVALPGRIDAVASAEGSSKQEAETAAARALLEKLVTEPTADQSCGLIAVVGAPNAGKSTLVNALVGQKVAIVSPKAQTTRVRLMGVAIEGDTQILLVDTPGIFEPRRRLDRAMVAAAWGGASDADLIALVIDAKAGIKAKLESLIEGLAGRREPRIVILNKVDVTAKEKLLELAVRLNEAIAPEEIFMVSAATGDGIPELKAALAKRMPAGPWHFPEDQVSDATDRMLAAEVTREQLYLQLHAELPYASAIETEKYEERKDGSVVIHQQILVGRDTQRAIVLGKGGTRLKEIGSRARAELETLLDRKVHLFLHVKVKPDWEEDRGLYRDIGLDWVD